MKFHQQLQVDEEQQTDFSTSLISDKKTYRRRIQWIIFPDNKWIIKWDYLMLILIMFMMVVIPYQAGVSVGYYLVTSYEWFAINALIDLAFFIDTFLYFFRTYRDENGCFVINRKEIQRTYLRSSFLPNFIASLFPSVIFKVAVEFSQSKTYMEVDSFDAIKLVFLLVSLLKLLRFRQAEKTFFCKRTTRIFLEGKHMKPFVLAMMKNIFILFMLSHWFACLWCFIAFYESGTFMEELIQSENWIAAWYNTTVESFNSLDEVHMSLNPVGWENDGDRYILSLFWSTQTITSIGYGNILPYTISEYIISCLLMLFAGIFWAIMIGSLISIIDSMSVKGETRSKLYEMNKITRNFHRGNDSDAPIESFSKRVKQFVLDQKERHHDFASCRFGVCEQFKVYPMLSLDLKRMSSYMIFGKYLNAVPYLSSAHLNIEEQSCLLSDCQLQCFAAGETFSMDHSDTDDRRGILVMVEGFGFLERQNYYEDKIHYLKTGSAHGYKEVLIESSTKIQKERIFFPIYARILFIQRSLVLEVIRKHPHIWKNCARWKYMEYLMLNKLKRKRAIHRASSFFFEKD